jgi:hypothetical protein
VEQNPGEARRGSAGEGLGRSLWAPRALFGRWVGGERWPVSGSPAAREERPWWLLFRRGGGSGEGEASRLACVDVREAVGGADRRGEPAEERRTAEAGGGSGRSGAQGDGGAWGRGGGLYMQRGCACLGPVDRWGRGPR